MTIKEFRIAQGLSQPKLAKALGIGTSTVGGYESGRINPSEKVIAKIKEIFNVDLNDAKPAPEKKAPAKKAAAPAKKSTARKPVRAKKAVPAEEKTEIILQSPMGGEITTEEILAKVGKVDKVYVRIDQNAAYWVKGEDSGAVNLW